MPKIIGFMALHYGKPYLEYAIRSVIDHVDEFWIAYTAIPSHGTRHTTIQNPDHATELLTLAARAAGDKLRWREGYWQHEGYQRDSIYQFAPDADIIVTVDSDEVWKTDQLEKLIEAAQRGTARNYLAYEFPFWRSFRRAIPDSLCAPVRAVNTRNKLGTVVSEAYFAHFGYCQPTKYIDYKMSIHGHIADWRADWYTDKWLTNAQVDVHPTNRDFWNVREVNPLDYMPPFMANHPYFRMDIIR
jgi:hypothetical protein